MLRISFYSYTLFVSVLTTKFVFAGTFTWTGAIDNDWNTGGNWDLGSVPGSGDTATFNTASTPSLSSNAAINTIIANAGVTISGSSNTITFDNGGQIQTNTGSTVSIDTYVALQSGAAVPLTVTQTVQGFIKIPASGTTFISGGNSSPATSIVFNGYSPVTNQDLQFVGTVSNTYTGTVVVNSGRLGLNKSGGAIAIPGDLQILGSGQVAISNLFGAQGNQFNTNSNVTIDTTGTFIIFIAQTFGTFTFNAGAFSGGGKLTLTATGTPLQMRNTTIPSAIALTGGSSGNDIVYDSSQNVGPATLSGATFDFGGVARTFNIGFNTSSINAVDMYVSNVIQNDGGGGLNKAGGGVLQLTGTNTYTGPTSVSAGTLSITSDSNLGTSNSLTLGERSTLQANGASTLSTTAILLTGTSSGISFDTNGNSFTISSGISGDGPVNVTSSTTAGTLVLGNTNSYTGATNVNSGTLQANVASAFSPTSDHVIASGATLDLNNNNQTIGSLAGAGSVTLGSAALTTGSSSSTTFSGDISGSGSLIKDGSTNFTITGSSNFGSTTVSAGRLSVNGNLITPGGVTVASGATLGGNTGQTNAITGNVTIQTGGTLSPGNSIGTINVVGNVVLQSGAFFNTEISPTSNSELVATGSFTIGANDTLNVTVDPGIYPASAMYVLVNAASGVNGEFTTVNLSLPTFKATITYPTDEVVLTEIATVPFATVVTGGNAGAVAVCVDSLSAPSGSDAELVIAELRQIPTIEELTVALARMQPSQFTALALAQENAMLYTSDTVFYRLHQITELCPVYCKSKNPKECPKEKHLAYWLTPYGGYSFQKNQNEQPGFHTKTGGVTTGFDVSPWNNWIVGGALGYSYDHLKWKEGFGHANIQDGFGAFYTGFNNKYAYLFGTLLGSYDHYQTARHIEIGEDILTEIDRTAKGSHNGWHASGHLEAGLLFGKKAQFAPFVQANYIYVHETSFNEHGAESLNLHVHKKNSDLLEGEAGFEISRCFSSSTNKFSPFAGFSVIREWRFTGKHYKSSFKGSSCVMKTTGMNSDRTLYSPVAGMTFLLPNENCTLSFEYKGKFGEKFHDNRILAQFLVRF